MLYVGLSRVGAVWQGQTQREHSGYMIITDTSPTKKRETAAQFWMSKTLSGVWTLGCVVMFPDEYRLDGYIYIYILYIHGMI